MQKDSAQAKISLKVVGGLLFFTHPVRVGFVAMNFDFLAVGLHKFLTPGNRFEELTCPSIRDL